MHNVKLMVVRTDKKNGEVEFKVEGSANPLVLKLPQAVIEAVEGRLPVQPDYYLELPL